jgi:hypothetical protein
MSTGSHTFTISDAEAAWHLDLHDGRLTSTRAENHISGRTYALSAMAGVSLTLSASPDGLAEPKRRVDDFFVVNVLRQEPAALALLLRSRSTGLEALLELALEGPTRRKTVEVRNVGTVPVLLLDVVLDDFDLDADVSEGGQGQPVFAAGGLWAAVEHPSGWNETRPRGMRLSHCPGRRLAPGDRFRSRSALITMAPAGGALESFVAWIQARCIRRSKGLVSVYTPFGINNQWGPCSTLDDEQALHVLGTLGRWRRAGARFDYFTLDTGWVDTGSDLTRFRPVAYPEGPAAVTARVRDLGMKFGLWFATSWASQSCWEYRPAWGTLTVPPLTWRNGHAAMTDYAGSFCLAAPPYFALLQKAVLHHVRENGARFLKFDGGNYACDDPSHGHLPGRYATERMHDLLIELADAARAEAPDVFVMWYWGLRSPFWALHGDTIFESGLFMEGSGTSSTPTLHYRDSVTLAQDQNAVHARTIPPIAKDSLGVWLADTRWGNYLGRERWREAMVMDLGRGNLLFPNLWGDVGLLEDDDVAFLAAMERFARANETLLFSPRVVIGDPKKAEAYAYAYGDGRRALVFLNNPGFAARPVRLPLGEEIGLRPRNGTPLAVTSRFPDRERVLHGDGRGHRAPRAGEALEVWLRPFEVLVLEIGPRAVLQPRLPVRLDAAAARGLGRELELRDAPLDADLEVIFADTSRFVQLGHRLASSAHRSSLPDLAGGDPSILAVAIRLSKDGAEWKYSPAVAEVVQATARVGDERAVLVPVPDARQFGNTQKAGCSWVVYKTRLPRRWSGAGLRLAVHGHLPPDVSMQVGAWVVRRWWRESARPVGDGYYADAPS